MQKKEELIQNFKTAIASTTKSVSNVKDIEVIFGNEKLKTNKKIIKLPIYKISMKRLTIQKQGL